MAQIEVFVSTLILMAQYGVQVLTQRPCLVCMLRWFLCSILGPPAHGLSLHPCPSVADSSLSLQAWSAHSAGLAEAALLAQLLCTVRQLSGLAARLGPTLGLRAAPAQPHTPTGRQAGRDPEAGSLPLARHAAAPPALARPSAAGGEPQAPPSGDLILRSGTAPWPHLCPSLPETEPRCASPERTTAGLAGACGGKAAQASHSTLQEVPRRCPSRFQARLCSWSPWASRAVGGQQAQHGHQAGLLAQPRQEPWLCHLPAPEGFPREMAWSHQDAAVSTRPCAAGSWILRAGALGM